MDGTLRKLALSAILTAAVTGPAHAQMAVIDAANVANTAQTVTQLISQLETMKKQLDQEKQIYSTIGNVGAQSGLGSAVSIGNDIKSTAGSIVNSQSYGSWVPKDAKAPDFANVEAARAFFLQALTMGTTKDGQYSPTWGNRPSADVQTIMTRRRNDAESAALSGLSLAASTPASVAKSVKQAEDLSDQMRSAADLRAQVAVLGDSMSALINVIAKLETQLAALNQQMATARLAATPVNMGMSNINNGMISQ